MSANLINNIQNSIGNVVLKKIDPNTQATVADSITEDKLNQAAIPAVLIILYKYTRRDEGATHILEGSLTSDWLEIMMEDDANDVVRRVADYATVPKVIAEERMEMVAKQAVGIIQRSMPENAQAVKDAVAAERNNILTYLPPSLQIGELLNDTTLDDTVTKMEGPVSSLMNKLSNAFSSSEKGKDD